MKAETLRSLLFPSLVGALGVGMALLPQLVSNTYELRIWMLLTIYALVALGLNILVGLTGLVSLGQAGLFAIGAYVAAILAAKLGVGFVATIVIAMIVAALFGALLAYPTVRVKGVYLAVITIAFGIIVENVAIEWQGVTGGTNGISAIPGPAFLGKALDDTGYFYLLAVLFLAAYVLHYNIMKSRFGRAMHAVSQSEIAARSMGINPIAIRTFSFVIAAAFAGMAGGLYAYLNLYVNPDTFRFDDSVRFLLMVILGGSGTIVGPVLGATVLTFLPEYLQAFGEWQRFAYGALLALVMFCLPLGIVGALSNLRGRFRASVSRASEEWPRLSTRINTMLQVDAQRGAVCLKTKGLTMAFGGLVANDNVSEVLRAGQVHAVIGPNGAGKSTFINCVSGFYAPTGGEIEFLGVSATRKVSHELARMGLARTFQNTELFGNMTVLENVLVGYHTRFESGLLSTLFRMPSFFHDEKRFQEEAKVLLEYVGLAGFADELAKNLPFGHQRRLEIARALALSPKLLLLDEPAAGLTHGEIESLSGLIRDLAARHMTMILVEHHVDMIMAVSDHVTVLDYGKVIASGPVAEVRNNPAVIEAYFGSNKSHEDPEPALEVRS
ncbi:branched-chain amino acid ABC transporter ATP-binding protein/permease (plasmid) [Cupriavidus sp. KK10]|jgi:ABC-type branched-subunit amino acid transport system ATPase component/ABC-type branched-subunit amino acid transport system permease subunit|uniref:branched-chain amino acid ABC transporter ATP-binding protein/permease n=1 Tax=Cupriavidus sp. KK10 TaxID=1478019 RepID=UPI001BAA2067|nr:branched-chain amino acid ABC transporter ATP-binding protein/permease [Cupriavidus sp. KK10]QUN32664.1 branched-chain amino acid ABC transporter ATP-binding protein/permease [Cupriavidus sp. KK10]